MSRVSPSLKTPRRSSSSGVFTTGSDREVQVRSEDPGSERPHHARVMCTISVISLGCNSVQVMCPIPAVASSTATVSEAVRTSPHTDDAWRTISGSADMSPLTVFEGSLSTGRTTESAAESEAPVGRVCPHPYSSIPLPCPLLPNGVGIP